MKQIGKVEGHSAQFITSTKAIASVCQSMYPDWPYIRVVSVPCVNYKDYASCQLIRVGAAGWKPSKEAIDAIAKELQKYGLVEKPGWFPTLDLKGALH